MFNQHDKFIYCDVSVYFVENNFADYFELINDGRLVGVQLTKSANRGIATSTSSYTHQYLPLERQSEREDVEMFQSSMVIVKRSPEAREILKWAVLCSVTAQCILPPEGASRCGPQVSYLPPSSCHSHFTSIINTLIYNRESALIERGERVIRHSAFNHPSKVPNVRERHLVVGEEAAEEAGKIDTCRSKRELFESFNSINAFTITKHICNGAIE